ncbi:apolipoprotein N-acyltransferase [Balneolaceae bacterium ANBcel3]|nr:apolipoprotein N-acyltransferase [Balneolaceae bacterium ANBcel3]
MSAFHYFWNQKGLLALFAGIFLGLSYPPFTFPLNLLVFPAWIMLFRLNTLAESARESGKYSYIAFLTWNIITTYWLMFATVPGGIAAILANSAIMTVPFMLMYLFQKRTDTAWLSALIIPSFWMAYEFLHFRWDLSWPWLHLGNSFAVSPWLVQYISITGIGGITFWILCASWLMYKNAPRLLTFSVMLLPPLFSLFLYASESKEPERNIEIGIVQPNYDSYLHLAGYDHPVIPLQSLLDTTSSLITSETKVVFWPENAIMALIQEGLPGESDRLIQQYVEDWDIPLISGSSFLRRYAPDEAPPVVRTTVAGKPANVYNSALGFYPDGSMSYYKKAKLVPLVERFPFLHALSRLDVFDWINWSSVAMFGRGNTPDVFDIDGVHIPALICYDSVYPDWVRRFVLNDAGVLVVITNDGWWGNTSGHIQHFEFARLRAIEMHRTVLRSANNGLSGVIYANGDVAVKTTYWTEDRFVYDVPVYTHATFYVRYGDWLNIAFLLLAVSSLLWLKISRNRREASKLSGS